MSPHTFRDGLRCVSSYVQAAGGVLAQQRQQPQLSHAQVLRLINIHEL
jgi:hypothetical protein